MDSLRTQLAAKAAEMASQLAGAGGLVAERSAAEARAREADRAKGRLELEVTQLREVGRVGAGVHAAASSMLAAAGGAERGPFALDVPLNSQC